MKTYLSLFFLIACSHATAKVASLQDKNLAICFREIKKDMKNRHMLLGSGVNYPVGAIAGNVCKNSASIVETAPNSYHLTLLSDPWNGIQKGLEVNCDKNRDEKVTVSITLKIDHDETGELECDYEISGFNFNKNEN